MTNNWKNFGWRRITYKLRYVSYEGLFVDWFSVKMVDHLKQNEAELNELLSEYWIIRYEAGMWDDYSHSQALRLLLDVYMETLANKLNMQVTSGWATLSTPILCFSSLDTFPTIPFIIIWYLIQAHALQVELASGQTRVILLM